MVLVDPLSLQRGRPAKYYIVTRLKKGCSLSWNSQNYHFPSFSGAMAGAQNSMECAKSPGETLFRIISFYIRRAKRAKWSNSVVKQVVLLKLDYLHSPQAKERASSLT